MKWQIIWMYCLDNEIPNQTAQRLEQLIAFHEQEERDPKLANNLPALRQFQIQRLKTTHKSLLESEQTHQAAYFFFTDIYSEQSSRTRDEEIAKVYSHMSALLPEKAHTVLDYAIQLQWVTMVLDHKVAAIMPNNTRIDLKGWVDLYQQVACYEMRAEQIEMMEQLGNALAPVVEHRSLLALIRALHWPAVLAGYAELQSFIERGFSAFSSLSEPEQFVSEIVKREKQLAKAIQSNEKLDKKTKPVI